MGDDQDGLPVLPHLPKDGKEALGLLRREYGSRLIENQNVRAAVEHLHDLDGLLFGDRELIDLLLRIQAEAVAIREFRELLLRGSQIVLAALFAEYDILRRRKDRNQLKVLVYHADAKLKRVLRRAYADRLAVYLNVTAVRKIDAGEHVHERRLAASVLPE